MKINRKDQLAIASLVYENYNMEDEYTDQQDMEGEFMENDDEFSDNNVFSDDEDSVQMDVIQIDPVSPVAPTSPEQNEHSKQVLGDLKKLTEYTSRLESICSQCEIEPWMVAKISKAAEYVSDVYYMLDNSADYANDGFDDTL